MTALLKYLGPGDVNDWKTFATYCQQRTGTPYPTTKEIPILRKTIKEFFELYPKADYFTLCRVVDWCRSHKKRYRTTAAVLAVGWKYAWSAGYLPELDPSYEHEDEDLEELISDALAVEDHEGWIRRLSIAQGNEARRKVYDVWCKERKDLVDG